ncbi:hypothetical protein GALL_144360 [mine drainage metagenome]|uniref:Uncharacterized protein n=1 Tax=mine drainage metagenome TaxID=410659 RepID=A0A1J5S561_9ZZZZ
MPDGTGTEVGLEVLKHIRAILEASRKIGVKTHEVSSDENVVKEIDSEVERIADACMAIAKMLSD